MTQSTFRLSCTLSHLQGGTSIPKAHNKQTHKLKSYFWGCKENVFQINNLKNDLLLWLIEIQ
jgi:hypothetical protein